MELLRREDEFAIEALEELAIYHEHRRRDAKTAMQFVKEALRRLRGNAEEVLKLAPAGHPQLRRFTHRMMRLQKKSPGAELQLGQG